MSPGNTGEAKMGQTLPRDLALVLRQICQNHLKSLSSQPKCLHLPPEPRYLSISLQRISGPGSLQKQPKTTKARVKITLTAEAVEFVDKLIQTRKRLGVTQLELAKVFGVTDNLVSDFEKLKMTATNWKMWQPLFDSWVQDHSVSESIEQIAVMEKYFKENLCVPSDSKAQQIAEDINLEVKRVKLWFLNRHQVWSLL